MSDLIDTTEMYLRTIFELEEAGIPPLRARITERLGQSGPTVSQTVARMERDGLLHVDDDRRIVLSAAGQVAAAQVMRRHRLAECLLVDVLKVPLEAVHAEACKWEHVISEVVEERILDLLGRPTHSPFGNPIPGVAQSDKNEETLAAAAATLEGSARFEISRIDETLHAIAPVTARFAEAGMLPGSSVEVSSAGDGFQLTLGDLRLTLSLEQASHVYVRN